MVILEWTYCLCIYNDGKDWSRPVNEKIGWVRYLKHDSAAIIVELVSEFKWLSQTVNPYVFEPYGKEIEWE